MAAPLVSIIIATYNRSNILGYAINSVLHQTLTDWELIVVGDCCTDDTEAVVASFQDPRVSFVNLRDNFGEQSKPNNEGVRYARGRYIAFLNHDDLWFSDHLEESRKCLEANAADLVLAGGFIERGDSDVHDLTGIVPRKSGYHPADSIVPASNWLFKKELAETVGPWRPAKELYLIPSHDWLERVFEAKKNIVPTQKFTVLAVPSSLRKNSYSDRQHAEHDILWRQMTSDPKFREDLLSQRLYTQYEARTTDERNYPLRFLRRKAKKMFHFWGVNTIELSERIKFGKGGRLRHYRRTRGLPEE